MKSKVEIRKFAVQTAADLLGTGSATKDVIAKAKEIEEYIVGQAEIPETYSETSELGEMFSRGIKSITGIAHEMGK